MSELLLPAHVVPWTCPHKDCKGDVIRIGGSPFSCTKGHKDIFVSPRPSVAIALELCLPNLHGVVFVTRAIHPIDEECLAGGFLNPGETLKQGGVREYREEAGIPVPIDRLKYVRDDYIPDNHVTHVIFSARWHVSDGPLPPFVPNKEAKSRRIVTNAAELPNTLFTIHREVAYNILSV